MRRPTPCLLAATIAAASLTAIPFAGPAAAGSSAQCTKLVAPAPTAVNGVRVRTARLSGCTPTSATGGSGTSITNLTTLVSTTTWDYGAGTTVVKSTYRPGPSPNNCPNGTHLTISGGRVTGGSGAALNVIKVGSTVNARWCVSPQYAVTLEPGSAQKFSAVTANNSSPPPAPVPLPAGLKACPSNAASAVTALANRDRKRVANAPPLKESANLDWAARKHAIAMAVKGYSFHDGWDTEIRDSRFVAGPPYWEGQNVGWMISYFDPKLIESGYFDEKPPEDGHRLNILNTNYHYIGVGCVIKKSNNAIFSTQDFGS